MSGLRVLANYVNLGLLATLLLTASSVQASSNPAVDFSNQIISEINALKNETYSVGIPVFHANHLVNRLNVAKYFVKKGRNKLQEGELQQANYAFWVAKHYVTRYIRLLHRKVGNGKISAATAALLKPDALVIRAHLKQLIRGELGNGAPVANAGLDQSVLIGQSVTLDGSGSSDPDGDPLSFQWTLVSQPTGSSASLADSGSVTPTLTPDITGSYVVELVVADAEFSSAPDSVAVNVAAPNTQPVANAGPDQAALQGDLITLDGSASSDADGDNLGFSWTLITSPGGSAATFDSPTAVMPTFTADESGLYEAELTVNDGRIDSDPDVVAINVDTINTAPVANAGPDQGVFTGAIVQLDGSQSSDVDGDSLTWFWSITTSPTGSTVTLDDEFSVMPTFTADLSGQYVIQLVVNDGETDSAPDSVIVNALIPNTIPVADAGPDQSDFVGSSVTLDGSGSSDADNDVLSYNWSLTSTPENSVAAIDDSALVNPSFVLDLPGIYVAQLIVNDGQANSAPDETVISTLNSRPVANAGVDQTIIIGDIFQLDGSASSDADNDPLSYQWSVTSRPEGSVADVSDAGSSAPTITPDEIGFYVVQLIVSDGTLDSNPVTVTLQVNPVDDIAVTLNAPNDGLITNQSDISFIGSLNHTGTLTINGTGVTIESDLSFDYQVALNEGLNTFNLLATDAVGTQESLSRQVTLDTSIPPVPVLGFIFVGLPDSGSGLVTITGQDDSVEPFSEVVIVNNRTGEITIVIADANGAFSVDVNGLQGDSYSILSEDAAGNQSESIETDDGSLPDDPEDVAPLLIDTGVTSIFNATSFLYTGADPIQTGVAPGTIDLKQVAVIRGKVTDKQNNPLPGVTISIKDHPEFGETLSRSDGMFDMAVNGGDRVILNYRKSGYLPSQRGVDTGWQDYFYSDDVVLIQPDSKVTEINLLSTEPMQVATANLVTDMTGSRTAMVMVPQGTVATINLPGGGQQQLNTMNLRITEYTVDDNGPETMPGSLPSISGYTYALEFTVDEVAQLGGIKVDGSDVNFSQPVYSYVENFLGFPVGGFVPVGFYDPNRAAWIADDNGRIIEILSVTDGMADIDVDGQGSAAGPNDLAYWGITDDERTKLAEIYSPGQSLWRVSLTHFSTGDYNGAARTPPGAKASNETIANPDNKDDKCPNTKNGCIINIAAQTLGEDVEITGSGERLHYVSDWQRGYEPKRSLLIPLTDATPSPDLKRIDVIIEVAGQQTLQSFNTITPNMQFTYVWDGKDAYGRDVTGTAKARVIRRAVYPTLYAEGQPRAQSLTSNLPSTSDEITRFFGVPAISSAAGSQPTVIRNDPDREIFIENVSNFTLGTPSTRHANLGGWTISSQHFFDPNNRNLYLGTGQIIKPDVVGDVLVQNAGGGQVGTVNGGPATDLKLAVNTHFAPAQDGGYYVVSAPFNRIHKINPDGTAELFAGVAGGGNNHSGDGGLAVNAEFTTIHSLGTLSDGSVIVNSTARIRKIDPNGIVTTIAGTGQLSGDPGDGGLATDANINNNVIDIAIGSDDSIYFTQQGYVPGPSSSYGAVRRIDPNGIISHYAGFNGGSGDGGPAVNASLRSSLQIAIDSEDNLYIADIGRIRRVDPNGTINTIYGNGTEALADGVNAADVEANLILNFAGELYMNDRDEVHFRVTKNGDTQIYKIRKSGILQLIAGGDASPTLFDGVLAEKANLGTSSSMGFLKTGEAVISGVIASQNIVFKFIPPLPAVIDGADVTIASTDGRELYSFNGSGQHLATTNTTTGATMMTFNYDANGYLDNFVDAFGAVTDIERDSSGNVTAIVTPDNHRTVLTLNAENRLETITNPLNDTITIGYAPGGLMNSYSDYRDKVNTFTYDTSGRLTDDFDPVGGGWNLIGTDVTSGRSVTLTSGEQRVSQYDLIQGPNFQTFTLSEPDGSQFSSSTGTNGLRLDQLTDGTIVEYTSTGDSRFGMQSPVLANSNVRTPSGLTRTVASTRNTTLTDQSNLLSVDTIVETDTNNGRVSTSTYDATTQTWTQTSTENRTATVQINPQGQPVLSQITGLNSASYSYDTRGRLQVITEGSGVEARITTLSFYQTGIMAGFLESIEDAENQVTIFEYDALGRVTKQILPDTREIGYSYDANGNLASLTPPGRPVHVFDYTGVDLESQYTPPTVPGVFTPQTVYTYNLDQQLTDVTRPDGQQIMMNYGATTGLLDSMTIPTGIYGYSYDPTSAQLTGISAPGGNGLSYAYDGFLLTNSSLSGDVTGSVGRVYDTDYRISSRNVNGASTISFDYDDDSLLTQAGSLTIARESQKAGLINGTTLGLMTTSRSYNGFAEMDNFDASYNGNNLFSTSYIRDKLGRIEQKTEIVAQQTSVTDYVYDSAGRLESETTGGITTTYTYDSNGNRSHINGVLVGTYDDQDRLQTYGTASYQYTDNGELLSKTESGITTNYQYDVLGNLRQVTLPGGMQIDYVIDGQNRRVGKKINGVLTQGFLYKDKLNPIVELDGNNNVVARFIYGTKINVPDYMEKNGSTYRIISDHLGSPRFVIDITDGSIVQHIEYDTWGNIASDTNPGFQPFGFAGGIYDQHTLFTRFGARDYDAESGRWTIKDPIRFAGGDPNLYGYVINDPVNFNDAVGEFALNVAGGIFGAVSGGVGAYIASGGDLGATLQGAVVGGATGLIFPASLLGSFLGGVFSNTFGQAIGNYNSCKSIFDIDAGLALASGVVSLGGSALTGHLANTSRSAFTHHVRQRMGASPVAEGLAGSIIEGGIGGAWDRTSQNSSSN